MVCDDAGGGVTFGLDWIGLDWIGLDWVGVECGCGGC